MQLRSHSECPQVSIYGTREGVNPPYFPRMPIHESILVSDKPLPITLYHTVGWIYLQALVA